MTRPRFDVILKQVTSREPVSCNISDRSSELGLVARKSANKATESSRVQSRRNMGAGKIFVLCVAAALLVQGSSAEEKVKVTFYGEAL